MKSSKKLVFGALIAGILAFAPVSFASADSGRYFIKSTKSFWKNALGARHVFDNGFTADMSDFQVRFSKIWGLEIEPVKTFQILGTEKPVVSASPKETASPVPTPTPPKINDSLKAAKGRSIQRPEPSDQTPWGLEAIYNDAEMTKSIGGKDIEVAVLDTGINTNHPDLKGRILICKDFTNPKLPVIDGKCEDKNGHGTHVAGIIAADGGSDGKGIFGVAPEAKLLVFKVCGANGSCYADDIAAAIKEAAGDGADVINMSFGSDSDIAMVHDAINFASDAGVLPVAAAGNDGPFDASIDYPAALANVIAVGAVNQSGIVSEWSSRGLNESTTLGVIEEKDIEFAAPGENIESTYNDGGYAILSGTSMASPFVAGLAAKLWQPLSENPAQSTRDLLRKYSYDIAPTGEDNQSGYGMPRMPQIPATVQ